MYSQRVGLSIDSDGDSVDTNIQDAIDAGRLTIGQYTNMLSKLAGVGEEEPDELKTLREANEALTQRIEKAAVKYREFVAKYNSLVAAYNDMYAKLDSANKANAHMRWLLGKNNIAIN